MAIKVVCSLWWMSVIYVSLIEAQNSTYEEQEFDDPANDYILLFFSLSTLVVCVALFYTAYLESYKINSSVIELQEIK